MHQLLHGYSRGHELLAGSTSLPAVDAELIVRLSDLSGTLPSDGEFEPYLTTYPLPSQQFYVVACTWLDRDAPRSGCVLTHSLLIPSHEWLKSEVRFDQLVRNFGEPSRDQTQAFTKPLQLRIDQTDPGSTSQITSPQAQLAFVSKYFGDGLRPIVWFDQKAPEAILARIVDGLWPALRQRFAACTFSLQPRSLHTGSFDLLFAPSSVYARFSRLPRENFIEPHAVSRTQPSLEPWCKHLAARLFSEAGAGGPPEFASLHRTLSAEPTAIRRLYMLNDLRRRSVYSPMAALGAMDIVESLSPNSEPDLEIKSSLVSEALAAGDSMASDKALEHLHLVSERLAHPAFEAVSEASQEQLRQRVAANAAESIEQGLISLEQFLGNVLSESSALDAYRGGIVVALSETDSRQSERLSVLSRYPAAASDIVGHYPRIASIYLQKVRTGREIEDILKWIRWSKYSDPVGLIVSLLIDVSVSKAEPIFDELFARLSHADVARLLEGLRIDRAYRQDAALKVVARYLSDRFSGSLRSWALSLGDWSPALARLTASTFQLSKEGLELLLHDESIRGRKLVSVLAEFTISATEQGLPRWLQSSVEDESPLLPCLLEEEPLSVRVGVAVLRIVQSETALPLSVMGSIEHCLNTARPSMRSELREALFGSQVRWILRGGLPIEILAEKHGMDELADLYKAFGGQRIANLVTEEAQHSALVWERAWVWVATLPGGLYRSDSYIVDLVKLLCRQAYVHWREEVAENWILILHRAFQEPNARANISHSVQALQYAYRFLQLPLGRVVRAAFPLAYQIALSDSEYVGELGPLLSYSDWDRARALRGSLVDSFVASPQWRPGDLALVAAETFGLRKLFKRVTRKYRGDEYVERMVRDLVSRPDHEAREIAQQLIGLVKGPYFYEPWV